MHERDQGGRDVDGLLARIIYLSFFTDSQVYSPTDISCAGSRSPWDGLASVLDMHGYLLLASSVVDANDRSDWRIK
jgi:hypothetical protein